MLASLIPVLLADKKQNLILRSEEFGDAAWTLSSGSVTADQVAAPDGSVTADLLTIGSGAVIRQAPTLVNGIGYVMAARLKKQSVNFAFLQIRIASTAYKHWFNLNTGAVASKDAGGGIQAISDQGNGWYLCSVAYTFLSGSGALFDISACSADGGTDGGAIYGWGAQLNSGPRLRKYVRTAGTAVA